MMSEKIKVTGYYVPQFSLELNMILGGFEIIETVGELETSRIYSKQFGFKMEDVLDLYNGQLETLINEFK